MLPAIRDAIRDFFAFVASPQFEPIVITAGWLALLTVSGFVVYFALKIAYYLIAGFFGAIREAIAGARRRRQYARYLARGRNAAYERQLRRTTAEQPVPSVPAAAPGGRLFTDAPTRAKISRAGWYEPRPRGPRDWSPPES